MSGFELNKLCGAVLLAALIAMLTSFVAEQLVESPEHGEAVVAYPLVALQSSPAASDTSQPVALEPITPLLATANPDRGQRLARACRNCHTFTPDRTNRIGPGLWDIVQRNQASTEDFAYSAAFQAQQGRWGYEELNRFLANPRTAIPGNKMNYIGLRRATDRADLISWLRTLSDVPQPQ